MPSKSGSDIISAKHLSAVARSGQRSQEKTTTSSSCFFTAMGKLVCSPSGTSSPQVSTCSRAPYFWNSGQDLRADSM